MHENWYLEIDGKKEDLEKLVSLKFESKFSFFKVKDQFFIKSEDFNGNKKIEEILEIGESIAKTINGMSKINLNFKQDSFKCMITIKSPLNNGYKSENCLGKWIELSQRHININKVFILLNYGLDSFFNSYRIYEIIKKDLGKNYYNILDMDKDNFKRFTGSANIPEISGELARHGYLPSGTMNKEPMGIGEAEGFIYEMIYKWLHYKLEQE